MSKVRKAVIPLLDWERVLLATKAIGEGDASNRR